MDEQNEIDKIEKKVTQAGKDIGRKTGKTAWSRSISADCCPAYRHASIVWLRPLRHSRWAPPTPVRADWIPLRCRN